MKNILLFVLLSSPLLAQKFTPVEISRWKGQAQQISITRDRWGIPHIAGKTDADAVFGMLYAQCEDDFERVERNYVMAIARLAEVEGENMIYNDLRMRLFIDSAKAITLYQTSPEWMKKVCQGFADGINYFLYTHPDIKPKLIKRFQPWMPLLFSEGSIGGDIESVSLNDLKSFYGKEPGTLKQEIHDDGILEPEPRGSNGFAIAPSRSANGNAMLLINPHTSFYFRSELHMKSDEGLNAYGAATWGQFFIYQGFNEHCGWMHTSSAADVIDEYRETVVKKNGKLFYKYGADTKPVVTEKVVIRYKGAKGMMKKEFTTYRTVHGPVTGASEGKWISTKLMVDPVNALTQSYLRTKAAGFGDFKKNMNLRTNSSNNTVYADDQGNIAYWHGDFMPRRNPKYNWNLAVDGSDTGTEWNGLHEVDEIVHVYNPAAGWIQNCNSTPFTVSGSSSPDKRAYPNYMAPDGENPRGIHAVKVLKDEDAFTLEKLIDASQDSYLPAFETLVPSLVGAYDASVGTNDTIKSKLGEAIEMLRKWDYRYSTGSVPTTLAISWAIRLRQTVQKRFPPHLEHMDQLEFVRSQTSNWEKLTALADAMKELQGDFGNWRQPWGEINRFQRITGKIEPVFDDQKPSLAVPFTSSYWGSLASFGARKFTGTRKMYGYSGNSFVAVVEFGRKVRAKSVVTGGSSSNPSSPHFNDQSPLYCQGQFKDVLFYPEDYSRNAERTYHPGEK